MPYSYYTKVSHDDVLAIRAYLATVPAVHNGVEADQLLFPLSVRKDMVAWNKPTSHQGRSGTIDHAAMSGTAATISSKG